jgi:hypothetical protein
MDGWKAGWCVTPCDRQPDKETLASTTRRRMDGVLTGGKDCETNEWNETGCNACCCQQFCGFIFWRKKYLQANADERKQLSKKERPGCGAKVAHAI